ncbi:Gfo/Idh/MocA family protein [Thalassotalea euphylliae]|uniref:Gfo/Idh/MocA family oxidoreductase n=1 Tax=Thalassotalea euphylliae TaxID=1655234 RepID=A0A3E0UE55_9GAMM|nr:Gfo/Idh/MocA family oxidoreductase [Thalassotalea euphylliae]REL34847.1 gfo/Idh/MocA family oxidoreductase [Thalassotalea euphylliae]
MTSSPTTPLQLAFIGGGETSAVGYVHFCASQMDNRFQVVAGAFCRDADRNQATAIQWGVSSERTYNDWQVLIENEQDRVDAFVLLTPTPDHLAMLEVLLKAGANVICEKSLVCGPKEAAKLRKFYDSSKQFLAVTYNYSGYPMVRELRQRIAKGELGKIQKIHLEMPQEGFRRPPDIAGKVAQPQAWRLHDEEVPTICLDLGVHLHHLSSLLIGHEPIATVAQFANHSQYDKLVDDVNMLLKYPKDIKGSMWMSKTAIGHRNGLQVRVYGELGSASWYQLNPDELDISYNDGTRKIIDRASKCLVVSELRYNRMKPGHPTGFVEAFANLYADIADSLLAFKRHEPYDSPYVYGLDHATHGLALFAAAQASDTSGEWEHIAKHQVN